MGLHNPLTMRMSASADFARLHGLSVGIMSQQWLSRGSRQRHMPTGQLHHIYPFFPAYRAGLCKLRLRWRFEFCRRHGRRMVPHRNNFRNLFPQLCLNLQVCTSTSSMFVNLLVSQSPLGQKRLPVAPNCVHWRALLRVAAG